eukprot:scaffold892_cov144-Alexandrium_tamarense.AAC.6
MAATAARPKPNPNPWILSLKSLGLTHHGSFTSNSNVSGFFRSSWELSVHPQRSIHSPQQIQVTKDLPYPRGFKTSNFRLIGGSLEKVVVERGFIGR